jgi:hypothetical protein
MTDNETNAERAHPARGRSGTAEGLARPLSDEERAREYPCCVRHPDAGGRCLRTATTMVYGLLFCEIHGAEATAGALSELYQDASDVLERLYNPHVPMSNAEAERALRAAVRELDGLRGDYEDSEDVEEAALRRAYPYDAERVCYETVAFDYRFDPDNPHDPSDEPTAIYEDARRLLCKVMRLAYEWGADWLVEVLEHKRESASAQLSFALEDYERKVAEIKREREEARGDRPAE